MTETIKDQIEKAQKAGLGEQLTAKQWVPEEGETIEGKLAHREIITRKEDGKTYEKIVLLTDNGPFETIIKAGTLAYANPPVVRGDILCITYNGLKPIGDGKKSMHDTTVYVFHTGTADETPY